MRSSSATAFASRAALVALVAAACARQVRPVSVRDLLAAGAPQEPVVVAGRAGTVRFRQPERGSSGITFPLSDGTGTIQVIHDCTLNIRDGALLQVRGERVETPEGPQLQASDIWFVGGRAPP